MGIGSDVGAGTTFSMLRTLGEAYKGRTTAELSPARQRGLLSATLGRARALRLEESWQFPAGQEADFVVIDPAVTPLQRLRIGPLRAGHSLEQLFVLMTPG
ncbi:amidohydrolase family protein [Klebsiella pneumoniae subsp. pneumoniae]|nr:amidohydrolase family protein [Klebsiella pneumoniae subsp. pneumoniae]